MEPCDVLVEDDRSTHRKTPGHSKWEKADILEMTVQYLQCLKNQQQATKSDPLSVGQFIAGFSECIRQIKKFSESSVDQPEISDCIDPALQQKLTDFLLSYLKNFSEDATKGLRNQAISTESSPDNLKSPKHRISPIPRAKSGQDSGSFTASPTSHHSPTSSSLSPKSPALSPGTSSNGSSTEDSPRKMESSDSNLPVPKPVNPAGSGTSYLTLYMPSSTQPQAFHLYGESQGGHVVPRFQGSPTPILSGGTGQHFTSRHLHPKHFTEASLWRPW